FFPKEIFRVDAVRPMYMFFEGGFYADLDFECVKPLDDYTNSDSILVGSMGIDPEFEDSIPNAMMASPALEGFWLLYLSRIVELHELSLKRGPETVTGPAVLKDCVKKYTRDRETSILQIRRFIDDYAITVDADEIRYSDIHVLPAIDWYPLDWTDYLHQQFRQELLRTGRRLTQSEVQQMFGRSHAVTYWAHSWTPRPSALQRWKSRATRQFKRFLNLQPTERRSA